MAQGSRLASLSVEIVQVESRIVVSCWRLCLADGAICLCFRFAPEFALLNETTIAIGRLIEPLFDHLYY